MTDGAAAPGSGAPLIGVLALQGGVWEHRRALEAGGAAVREVRSPAGLDGLDGLVLPGGESTSMTLGIAREGLAGPLRTAVAGGLPVMATCAGMILLDREHLDLVPMRCERNAFGRQIRSFEADLGLADVPGGPFPAVFIRAPTATEVDPAVRVLGRVDEAIVAVRYERMEAYAFHPELTPDVRLHRAFVRRVASP